MTTARQGRLFGKQKQQHLLILASGDKVRHLDVKPWMMGVCCATAIIFAIGYVLATSYLVLRDDLIGATMARQARMQYDYEDRISALRAQVDRITSRQLLDQQLVEDKVDKLIEQQEALSARAGKLTDLFGAEDTPKEKNQTEQQQPPSDQHAALSLDRVKTFLGSASPSSKGATDDEGAAVSADRETAGDRSDRMFSHMTLSLKTIEENQHEKLARMADRADAAADAITAVLRRFNLPVPPAAGGSNAVGGPFIEAAAGDDFGSSLAQLDTALTRYEAARNTAKAMPFANPALGKEMTSPFGNRRDPFLGKLALHSGIDFRFAPGEAVRPTAPGKVIAAGWTGGYGNMVEVDHGNGISTRYGHLSQILVSVGDSVDRTDRIGLAGSTGRSTGTHLHYEVREDGQAIDPIFFINAGLKLNKYIE